MATTEAAAGGDTMTTSEELRAALVVLEASCDEGIDLDTQPLVVLARRTLHEALDEIGTLRRIAVDLHWMARRYAEGRSSYATSLFNDHTRALLALGIEPNISGDGTPWARDSMGRSYDGLTDEEAAQGTPLHEWQTRQVPEEVARLRDEVVRLTDAEAVLTRCLEHEREAFGVLMSAYDGASAALATLRAQVSRDAPGRATDALVAELTRAQAAWPTLTVAARNAVLRLFVAHLVITGDEMVVVWVDDVARCLVKGQ